MTGTPQYTAAQLLDIASRYELDGNLDYAKQFYAYLAENLAGTPEAAQARAALERLAKRQSAYSNPSSRNSAGSLASSLPPQREQTGSPQPRLTPSHPAPQGAGATRAEPSLSAPNPAQLKRETSQPAGAGRAEPQRRPQGQQPQFSTPQGSPPVASNADRPQQAGDGTPLPRVVRGEEDYEDMVDFVPGYRVGRFLAFTMVLLGWLAIVAGIIFAGLAVAGIAGSQIIATYGGLPFGVLIGIGGLLGGLIMIFLGSLAQAAYEAANNTRELLEIERAKAGW